MHACTTQVPSHCHCALYGYAGVIQGSYSPAPLSIYLSNSHKIGQLSAHGLPVVLRAIPPFSFWPLGSRPMVQLAPWLYPHFYTHSSLNSCHLPPFALVSHSAHDFNSHLPDHPPHGLGHSAIQTLSQNVQGPKGHATWVPCALLSKHRCAVAGGILSCFPVTVGEEI